MSRNKELEAGLKAMAEDFHLPGGGHKKLSRLVTEHMDWFDAAERRGMGWRDMIWALTSAGITGRGGKSLSVGTLSSTVWRKRAEAENVISSAGRLTRPAAVPESRTSGRKASSEPKNLSKAAASKPASPQAAASPPPKPWESGKLERRPGASRSIQDKLSRVAKLRGG